jgi:hypothetical protein
VTPGRRDGSYRAVIFIAGEYEDRLLEETVDPASARGWFGGIPE